MSSSYNDPLGTLLQANRAAGDPEVKLALSRLSAQIKHRVQVDPSSSSHDFLAASVRALSRIRGDAHAVVRMACLFDCILFFYANDFDKEALEAVRQLDEIASRAQNDHWLRKAETLGGAIHADLGNGAEAIVRLSNALAIARNLGDAAGEISVLANLGGALMYVGLYKEAIQCLERAATLAREQSHNSLVVEHNLELVALTNLAQSHYYLGDYDAGLNAISLCLAKSTEPATSFTRVARSVREFTYVILALALGKLSAAREHTAICNRYAEAGGTRARVVAAISQGLCEVYGGDVNKGLSLLRTSVESSGRIVALRTAAMLALVRALGETGQAEQALNCVREVLDQMKAGRERGASVLLSHWAILDIPNSSIAAEGDDLRVLTLAEANLRAQVAEQEVLNTKLETLERLAITADLREDASGEHGYRVGRLASLLAEDLGWSPEACHALDLAARLHDIGKIGMPDSILLKSSGLLAVERHFLDAHTTVGAELLSKSGMPHFRLAEEVARFHHEWWDGTGYPVRLAGPRIPVHARIVALADVFDALTHGRPYANPWPAERALAEIRARCGTQFDPKLTERFAVIVERLQSQHADLDAALGNGSGSSTFLQARNNIRRLLARESENVRQASDEAALHA